MKCKPCAGRGIIADADIVVGSPWAPAEARRNQAAAALTGTGLVPASPLRQPLGGRGPQPHTSPLIKARVARRVSAPAAPCARADRGLGLGVLKGSGSSYGLMSLSLQGGGASSRGVAAGGMARSKPAAAGLARRKSAPGGKNVAPDRDGEAALLQVRVRVGKDTWRAYECLLEELQAKGEAGQGTLGGWKGCWLAAL